MEGVIAFIMAISDLISQENPNVWFLDASASIFSAFVLFVYGARFVKKLVNYVITYPPNFLKQGEVRPVSSVGCVSDHRAGGCGFEPWLEHQPGC